MTRFCPACGTQRAGEAQFCTQCGHRFAGEAPAAEPDAASFAPSPPQPGASPAYAAAPPQPAPAPTYTPPPAFQPQPFAAYAPPPMGYAPPQAASKPVLRWIIIAVGVVMIGLGLLRMLDGFGMLSGGSSRRSSSSSTSISETWMVGTWTPRDAVPCASWIRFNADRTLTDNGGNTGTWRIDSRGASGTLTMTINGMAPRSGPANRLANDLMSIGPQYWRRSTC